MSEIAGIQSGKENGFRNFTTAVRKITNAKCPAAQFVVSRMRLRIRIRKLLRDGENSAEHDGMHVAKRMRKREVRHYVYLHDE